MKTNQVEAHNHPPRPSKEWMEMVAETGDWLPRWGSKDLEQSPFGQRELDLVLAWLAAAYPTAITKRIFKRCEHDRPQAACADCDSRDRRLLTLLSDFWSLSVSDLFALGLDGALADPPKSLLDRLQNSAEYFGARNELVIMSGLKAAGIAFDFDPCAQAPGASPDFLLPTLGCGLFLEAKYCGPGSSVQEAVELADKISCKDRIEFWTRRWTEVEFTEKLRSLLSNRSGVRKLRSMADDLRAKVLAVLRSAHDSDETCDVLIDDHVRVRVGELVKSGITGSIDGALPDADGEAARIITNYLEKGASQLPSDRLGVVMIDVDNSLNPSKLREASSAWLNSADEGALYKGCIGVVLCWGFWPDDPHVRFLQLDPIWKRGVSPEYRARRFWDQFQVGMNWQRIATWEWAEEQVGH